MMQIMGKKVGMGAALLPLLLTASVMSAPVGASQAKDTVHRAVRAKILREASDRSHVEFLTTHTVRMSPRLRRVTGRGIFQRGRKAPQRFVYRGTLDVHSGMLSNMGYDINR